MPSLSGTFGVRAVASLALLMACGAGAALADNRGVVLRLGDSATGEIGPVNADADDFLVEITQGTLVTVALSAPKGSTLIPYLRFINPDGVTASDVAPYTKGIDTPKLSVKKYPISTTGTWLLRVVGASPVSKGTFTLKITGKAPKKAVSPGISLTDLEVKEFPFGGSENALLTLKLTDKSGPPLSIADVRVLGPSGDPIPGLNLARKGKSISAKKIPLTDGFGVYILEVTGPPAGGPSAFDVSIQVKPAKLVKQTLPVAGAEPQVTTVAPGSGPVGGTVTITGSGFLAGAVVWLNDTPGNSVLVQGAGIITFTIPGGPDALAGLSVRVSVQNPDGQENGKAAAFQYARAPLPTGVLPSSGPVAGDQLVSIFGTGFRVGTAGYGVTFGGTAATQVVVTSATQIQCRTPARAPGPVQVVVTDELLQVGNMPGTYLYIGAPDLVSLSPSSGPAAGGTVVTLTGTGFRATDHVFFGAQELSPVTFVSATSLEVTTSPSTGVVSVTVTGEFLQSDTLADAFTFESNLALTDATTTGLPAQGSNTSPAGWEIAAGDLDGDGDTDMVIADGYGFYNPGYTSLSYSSLHVLRNDGGLVFSDASLASLPTPRYFKYPAIQDRSWQGQSVQMGDLDGDSDLDLVVSNPNSFYSSYTGYYGGVNYYIHYAGTRALLNDGAGNFSNPKSLLTTYYYSAGMGNPYAYGYYGVFADRWQADKSLLGDLDGDGVADLVLVSRGHVAHFMVSGSTYYAYPYGSSSTRVLHGNGDGTFQYLVAAVPLSYTTTYGFPYLDDFTGTDARMGDLDGDGDQDLVVTHKDQRSTYSYPTSYPYSYGSPNMIGTRVLLNNGSGTFYFSYAYMPVTHGYQTGSNDFLQANSMELGDLDGDGDLDMVLASPYTSFYYDPITSAYAYRPGVRILTNDGYGSFSDVTNAAWGGPFPYNPYLNARSVNIGDVDGDGTPDLVLVTTGSYVLTDGTGDTRTTGTRVFVNDGSGGFSLAPLSLMADTTTPNGLGIFWTGRESFLGDLDGDSDADIVVTNSYSYYDYYGYGWRSMMLEMK